MGNDKNKINPTPGVYYDNEEEARKVELARAQNTWTESGETTKGTEDPNEMFGGDIEPAVFKEETKKIEKVTPSSTIPQVATTSEKGEPEITLPEPTNEHSLSNVHEIVGKAVVQGPSETEKAIKKTYDDELKRLDLNIKGLEGRRANALAQDETAQRRGRSMKMIAGISDSLASLANLIGVGKGGSNIDTTKGALTPLEQKLEAARLERKADIKSIDDRLEQYRNQMAQMKMQKGSALAAYKQHKEDQAYKSAEGEKNRTFQATEAEKTRTHQEKMADKQITANKEQAEAKFAQTIATKTMENEAKMKLERYRQAQANARAKMKAANSGSNASTLTILEGEDGKYYSYELTKAEKAAIEDKFTEVIKKDLEDPTNIALSNLYAQYEQVLKNSSLGIGTANKQEVEDLRNELIALSPTLSAMIKKGRKGTLVPMGESTPTPDDEDDEFAGNRL